MASKLSAIMDLGIKAPFAKDKKLLDESIATAGIWNSVFVAVLSLACKNFSATSIALSAPGKSMLSLALAAKFFAS